MEDNPLFNAGCGAVYNAQGFHESDASVMEGVTRRAGAVGAVTSVKNPVEAALKVMERSGHVLLAGKGADDFAAEQGCATVPNSYFDTPRRLQQWLTLREKEKAKRLATARDCSSCSSSSTVVDGTCGHAALTVALDHSVEVCENADSLAPTPCHNPPMDSDAGTRQSCSSSSSASSPSPSSSGHKFGTVGAVARDVFGNVAAATSTGGMTNKRAGRLGDTPVIGAGTYADNETAAISCTGYGEYFVRSVAAYDVCAMMKYCGLDVRTAAEAVVKKFSTFHYPRHSGLHKRKSVCDGDENVQQKTSVEEEGKVVGSATPSAFDCEFEGGLIAVDREGNYAFPFNSAGMYRGVVTQDTAPVAFIFQNE